MGKAKECLSRKVCYPTRASAEGGRKRAGGSGRVYRCECGSYHLTKSTHRGTARRRGRAKQRQRAWRD
jgi:hypothetical protein